MGRVERVELVERIELVERAERMEPLQWNRMSQECRVNRATPEPQEKRGHQNAVPIERNEGVTE